MEPLNDAHPHRDPNPSAAQKRQGLRFSDELDSDEKFKLLMDYAPVMIWASREDKLCTYFNKPWLDFTGRSPEDEWGNGWADGIHPDDFDRCLSIYNESFDRREPFEIEYRLRRHDGQYRWVIDRGAPRYAANGNFAGYISTCIDIHDHRIAEAQMLRTSETLERLVEERTRSLSMLNKELESFSYSVSHDLRGPLRAIDGFAIALQEDCGGDLGEKGRHYVERIRSRVKRMSTLIEDLLGLSRLTLRAPRPQLATLSALVHEIAEDMRRADPDRTVRLEIEPTQETVCDAGLMRIALQNLLENAWKFTSKAPAARIRFGSQIVEGSVVYFVEDNGAGFDMQCASSSRLFGPFQRLHPESEFHGHGIGLATVKRVIHLHGGQIWAEAAPGEGATFYFTLALGFPKTKP